MIRVGDTGTGMPPDVLGKIFEPFFTTKRRDEGTGLGLSTVYGIVKQAGGKIEVESTPGTGSSFRILFPAVNEPVESARGTSVGASPRGSETILVVEDDPAVRSLASEILRSFGYTVLVAASADEGCSASRSHAGQLHLLLTDVVLPGANGREMATEILRERPGLMILYMSGYPDESIRKIIGTEGSVQFLQKPFTPLVLATRVRSVLNLALAASR